MTKSTYKYYIGIDVSKRTLDVAISGRPDLLQLANTEAALKTFVKQLPPKKTTLIVLEASGGYEQLAANYLRHKHYHVSIVNAKRVRDFAKASGKLAKTDRMDAHVIMAFAQAFEPVPQALTAPAEKERLSYLHRRNQLVKMLAMEKQHLEQAPSECRSAIQRHLRYLEKELTKVEVALRAQIQKDPLLKEKIEKLVAIQGVGEVTAMNILLDMPELGKLSPKEAGALAGVAPYNRDSGQKKGKEK